MRDFIENIVQEGDIGLQQDYLIYNKEYHVWRDKLYLGIATYTNDPNIGDAFIRKVILTDGTLCNEVLWEANEWKFT